MNKIAIKNKTKRLSLRKLRIRRKISGTAQIPRVSLFCSHQQFYVQAINDEKSHTIAALSSNKLFNDKKLNKTSIALKLGEKFGTLLLEKNIKKVVFDRNGKLFHGRVAAFVNGMKNKGIKV